MQKSKLINIFNTIIISAILLVCGLSFVYNKDTSPQNVKAEYTVIDGVDHKLGKINRSYTGWDHSIGSFEYGTTLSDTELASYEAIDGNFDEPKFTMLYNHTSKLNAQTNDVGVAENIYFSFGAPQSSIIAKEDTMISFIIELNVTIYFNGTPIYVENNLEDTEQIPGTGGGTNRYFTQFIDLTNVFTKTADGSKGDKIENASGFYSIDVGYQVRRVHRSLIDNEWVYGSIETLDRTTMKYAFYLLDQSAYIDYPEFDSATVTKGNNSDDNVVQYFYNYDKSNYPTYTFDANVYNLEITKVRNKETKTFVSTFELVTVDDAEKGLLTFTNTENPSEVYSEIIDKVGNKYPVTLNFTEQGLYTIKNRYTVNVNDVYYVCDNIVAANTDLYSGYDLTENKSKLKLHIFGFTANFNNSGTSSELLMLNSGDVQTNDAILINANTAKTIYSDVTSQFTRETLLNYNGSTKLINTLPANFKIASTDQPPISFSYFGEYKYDGIRSQSTYNKYFNSASTTPNSTNVYLKKDAYLEDPGYYEVVIKYTYDDYSVGTNAGNVYTHVQAFVFTISNTSPQIKIAEADTNNSISENGFTNKDVLFLVNPNSETKLNDEYFNAPISVHYTRTQFGSTSAGAVVNYTQNTPITLSGKYNVVVSYGLNGVSKDTYQFIIDKDPISGIKTQAVKSTTGIDGEIYYSFVYTGSFNDYYNDSTLFNQPFTLLFNEKASGANINVTYKRIYFNKNLTEGSVVSGNGSTFVTTNYELNLNSTPQTSEYYYDRSLFNIGVADANSVFDYDTSCLILFHLVDEAGNEKKYYVIYDLTTPYVNINPSIENAYNIVSSETTVTWGDYKAIRLIGNFDNLIPNTSDTYTSYIGDLNAQFAGNDIIQTGTENGREYSYLTIPINQIYVNYTNSDDREVKNYYVKNYSASNPNNYHLHLINTLESENYSVFPFISSITLTPGDNGEVTNFERGLYVGENNITYNISDKSNITSVNSNIKNDNSYTNNVWLNLDKSLGLAFANVPGATKTFGINLAEKEAINANQLRFSYIPGEDNYEVGSVSYDYYEIDPMSYTQNYNVIYDEENNEPVPMFPFRASPTLANQTFNIEKTIVDLEDPTRVFSEIINQTTENGQTVTKSGMYVFKRTYLGDVETDKVRYYVYYIDRTSIINIDAELYGSDEIAFEQGYGFNFNFGKDGTKFTALQIQQYSASVTEGTPLFTSNKLPISFEIPKDKYNSIALLLNSNILPKYQESSYLSKVAEYNRKRFGISTIISSEYYRDGSIVPDYEVESEYLVESNAQFILNCVRPGTYKVELYDATGYYLPTDSSYSSQLKTERGVSFKFNYEITHSAPTANYHTKDLNLAVSNKESRNNGVNYQEFVSTNSDLLQLSFDRNVDEYKATIDTKNFTIYRDNTQIFRLQDNRAYLNNTLIFTMSDDIPLTTDNNGNRILETKFSSVIKNNGDKFEVKYYDGKISGFYNDEIVYVYDNGLFWTPDKDQEEKTYSSVFGNTLCTLELINDIATYTTFEEVRDEVLDTTEIVQVGSEVVFTLTDFIPIGTNGQIAKQYENIYVFNKSLNRYVITLYNANDTEHSYITSSLNEANYRVILNYEGSESDYTQTYTSNNKQETVNFFRKTFAITVDRTAPKYNLQQLIDLDKFHADKSAIDPEKYFFAVGTDFTFVKQSELETNEIFYRFLGDAGLIQTSYEFSITPDDPRYSSSDYSSHYKFAETARDAYGELLYKPGNYGRITGTFEEFGYYEIIERDEAGNYTVYALYYNSNTLELTYSYEQAESNGIIDEKEETLTATDNPFTVKGKISDSENMPLSGITVSVKEDPTKSVVTDSAGEFEITELVGIKTLEFISYDYSFIPAIKRVNELNYAYNPDDVENSNYINIVAYEKLDGILNANNTTATAAGQNLEFDFGNISNDYFLKAIIRGSNGSVYTIVNEPNITNIPEVLPEESEYWDDFINEINETINNFSTENNFGFRFTIEFVNRFGSNYTLNYILPGIMLEPNIREVVTNSRFTFTIPTDPSGTTYITKLEVRIFDSASTSTSNWVIMARDSTNQTINTFNDGNPLDALTYTFTKGEYMFTLTDNFNRVSVHYKGVGVNDVRSIKYGTNQVIGGVTYTASEVQLSYQTKLYSLQVIEVFANGTRQDITNNMASHGVSLVSSTDEGVRTFAFNNNEVEGQIVNEETQDGIKEFEVRLYVEKLDLTYTYKFIIIKTNPDIELRNLSGEKLKETSTIAGNPTMHTEDFTINWNASYNLFFTPKVKLTRVYFENNIQKTQVIDSIVNGYKITQTGTYTAEIYNTLGYSNSNKTIYFKRISGNIVMYSIIKVTSGYEQELEVSSDMPNIYIGGETGEAEPLYKYYALKYATATPHVYNYDTIEIRVNPSKGLTYRKITEADTIYYNGNLVHADDNIYRIFGSTADDGTVSYGYNRYIKIEYITSSSDFVKAEIKTEDHSYADSSATIGNKLHDNIKNISNKITIKFPGYFEEVGNPIKLSYTFNGEYVETISNFNGLDNELVITNAGIYELTFFDLAGNVQKYTLNGSLKNTFTISLINGVLFTVNNATPIENEIFNSSVVIDITNLNLYDAKDVKVTAKRDGKEIKLVNSSNYNSYLFEQSGFYTVTMTANVTSDNALVQQSEIVTNYSFTIINTNQALRSFNIPLNPNFTITKVLRENVNILYKLQNNKELWISSGDENTGSGVYTVTIKAYISATKSYRDFTFKVWINDEVPVIISSLAFGKSTTKQISISFNKNLIYKQLGDSIIRITGMDDIIINEETSTENKRETINLVKNLEYKIQVLTADGKVISSYKLIKKEPLNTVSIIVIVLVSVVVVGLIVTFIVLRKHIRYR